MKKAIIIARVSTEKQTLDEQLQQTIEYAKRDLNCSENELVICDAQGASAIKLDDKFKENINNVYQAIDKYNIKNVYAYHIDRIGRDEEFLMGFKKRLVATKTNIKIMNPPLTLLNQDGSVNAGIELAFSLFATMAKQEMEIKKDRFKRAKKAMLTKGEFIGGCVPFGYKVENKKIVIHEPDALVVRKAFNMYASGEYSVIKLSKELIELGYKFCDYCTLSRWFKNVEYCGKSLQNHRGRSYTLPPIVSEELFENVSEIKRNANKNKKQERGYTIGSKLIVCPNCGYHYIKQNNIYKCVKNRHIEQNRCSGSHTIDVETMDDLLVKIACECKYKKIGKNGDKEKLRIDKEIEKLHKKIEVIENDILKYDSKKKKVLNAYVNDIINESEYNSMIEKLKVSVNKSFLTIEEYKNKIVNLEQSKQNSEFGSKVEIAMIMSDKNSVPKDYLYELVHRNINKVVIEGADTYHKTITVDTVFGVRTFEYLPHKKPKILLEVK